MIIRVAVVPHPPLLVPELVTGAVGATEPVRSACVAAARRLAEATPDWIAVAVDPAGPAVVEPERTGTFRGFGRDVRVSLAEGTAVSRPDPELPLPALVAGWLRGQVGARRVQVHLLAPDTPVEECRSWGERLVREQTGPVGLLVLGDGSARHPDRAPGRPDERAPAFDAAVGEALERPDPEALLALDPALAEELTVVGRAAWQALAGAVLAEDRRWRAELLYSAAPFGVGYHVAVWDPVTGAAT
ncbi:MAG TPA: class III extradiol dioxygenase subunit B-like domain-containing protein [Pseudonocardiaceae bacterium]